MAEEKDTILRLPNLPAQDITKADEPKKPLAHGPESSDESDHPASRKELYSYYAYYAGNNGIGSFQ